VCFLFHKWSQWREYKEKVLEVPGLFAPRAIQGKEFITYQLRQKRYCLKCGKVQDKAVRNDL